MRARGRLFVEYALPAALLTPLVWGALVQPSEPSTEGCLRIGPLNVSGGNATVTVWVKPRFADGAVLSAGEGGGGAHFDLALSGGRLRLRVTSGGGLRLGGELVVEGSGQLQIGRWHLVGLVLEAAAGAGRAELYLDGTPDGGALGGWLLPAAGDVYLGGSGAACPGDGGAAPAEGARPAGSLAGTAVYKRALSAAEFGGLLVGALPVDAPAASWGVAPPVEEGNRSRPSGALWGSVYQSYVQQGLIAENDAYTVREVGPMDAVTLNRSAMRTLRWTLLSSAIYERWESQPRADARLVAVLSTTPRRIRGMRPAVDSILAQTYPPDALYVFVPHKLLRTGEAYEIPEWLQAYHDEGKVDLRRCDDLGPGTAVYAVLPLEKERDTLIFKVDDDQFYGPNTLMMLLRGVEVMPGRAITTESSQIYPHTHGVILQGVHGMLLRRGFFDDSVLDFSAAGPFSQNCWLHDDLWYSLHLAKKGIRRESLELRHGCRVLAAAYEDDALYQGGAGTDNYENFYLCNAALLQRYPEIWGPRGSSEPWPRVALLLAGEAPEDLYAALAGLQIQKRRPHQVYMCGATGWEEFFWGDWAAGCLITPLPGCHPQAEIPALIEVGVRLEADPLTVLMAARVDHLVHPDFLDGLVGCVVRAPLDVNGQATHCGMGRAGHPVRFHAVALWRGQLGRPGAELFQFVAALFLPMFDERALPKPPPPPPSSCAQLAPAVPPAPPPSGDHAGAAGPQQAAAATNASSGGAAQVAVLLIGSASSATELLAVPAGGKAAAVRVARVYVAPAGGVPHSGPPQDPRIQVLAPALAPLAALGEVSRQAGPRAALVLLHGRAGGAGARPMEAVSALCSAAALHPGAVVGLAGVSYRGLAVPLGPTLFPPGAVSPGLLGLAASGNGTCEGAEELWLAAHLAARGVPAVTAAPGQQLEQESPVSPDVAAWDRCFDALWLELGHRLGAPQHRVALFVLPVRHELISALPAQDAAAFRAHLDQHNLDLLEAQHTWPSTAYVLASGPGDGEASAWVGGATGFEVRRLECGTCLEVHAMRLQAAVQVEQQSEALILFAAAERLLNDQLVAENVDCAHRMLWGRRIMAACGYQLRANQRVAEFAVLRRHIAAMVER